MQIKITGKELKVTEAINDYVERKMDRIAKYFEDNFDKEKMFTQDEIKAIVRELVSEREKSGKRISQSFNEIWSNLGRKTVKKSEDKERE